MSANLPQYDPRAECPKCGSDDVGTIHRSYARPQDKGWPELSEDEHLLRVCRRCQYEWQEAVLNE